MSDLGPGTPLIFVGPDSFDWPSGLTIDALYFVDEVQPSSLFRELAGCKPMVSLKGRPGFHEWYCTCAFRPLGEGEPPPADEEEIEPPKEFTVGPLPKVPIVAIQVVHRARR